MILSLKVFRNKASSSAFELMMAGSFLSFIATFANQLSHVEISISAKVGKDDNIEVETELEVDIDEDEGEPAPEDDESIADRLSIDITTLGKLPVISRKESWSEPWAGDEDDLPKTPKRIYQFSKVSKVPLPKTRSYSL